ETPRRRRWPRRTPPPGPRPTGRRPGDVVGSTSQQAVPTWAYSSSSDDVWRRRVMWPCAKRGRYAVAVVWGGAVVEADEHRLGGGLLSPADRLGTWAGDVPRTPARVA